MNGKKEEPMRNIVTWLSNTPRFVQGMCSGTVVGLTLVALLQFVPTANALSLSDKRDCNPNAVINCGALTTGEVLRGYSNTGVADIYHYFGISAAEVSSLGTTAVAGQVSKSGVVTVQGKIVATGAVTAGRQNIAGSTKVTYSGTTFYTRPPEVSFASSPLQAFVVMKNGVFSFAILASCGNPVIAKPAKPVVKIVTTPAPQQPAPPAPTVTVAAVTKPAAPAPAQTLPNTGPGQVAIVVASAALGGTLLHFWYQFWRVKARQLAL
jgi:hypothetical protein